MKKFKKLLAGLLTGAMMLGSMTGTAFAEEGASAPVSTIDTTKTGSLTINKYEGNNTSKPLPGVDFTIYKIATIDQETTTPTGGNPYTEVQFTTVDGLDLKTTITGSTEYDEIKDNVDAALKNGTLSAIGTKTTAYNTEKTAASVTFNNLELGVYLVVETAAPSQVVEKTANFLVSIPMAETDSDGNAVGWNYDVVANPKNATVYGGIVLKKEGKTLNADGTSSTNSLSGIKFKLQTKNENGWSDIGEYVTGDNGIINVASLAPGTYRFIELGYAENVTDKGYIINTDASYEFTVDNKGVVTIAKNSDGENRGDIHDITTSGQGSNLTYTFTVINEKPKVDKFVMDGNEEKKVKDDQVGDTVTWKVKASIPKTIAKLKTYQLVDKLSKGLTVEDTKLNMIVKAGNTELAKGTDYTVTIGEYNATDGTIITVDFTDDGKAKLAGKSLVEVTFNSTLTKDAVIGKLGNPNDVTLKYSNTTDANSDSKPKEEQPTEIPAVFTYALDIHKFCKVDGSIQNLAGAEFKVYGSKADGTIDENNIIATGTSDADGKVIFTSNVITLPAGDDPDAVSVKAGTYYIKETKAPAGYNLLKDTIKVKYTITYTGSNKLTDRHQTATVTIENGNGTVTDAGHLHYEIENKKGFTLPSTGGMGTVIFSVLGIALVLAGLLVITASRKKAAK